MRAEMQCAQVYEREEESLRLNDVVEFVGVVSRIPELSDFNNTDGMDTFMEEELAARPPPSTVSHHSPFAPWHVVSHRRC